jgi:flagellar protein FlgJ
MESSGVTKTHLPASAAKSPLNPTADAQRDAKLRKACRDFESIFLFNLFKEMRKTVPQSGLLPPAPGKETFQMMFDQKVAEDLTGRGEGIGLQKLMYEQLRRR